MNENLKRFIYTLGTIFIVALIAILFIHILPWLLLIGVIVYIIIKIISFIKMKKEENNNYEAPINQNYSNQSSYEDSDDYTGPIIDVDYEEVDKKDE